MASEGLVLVPQPETAERARAVSFVWVLGRAGTDLSAGLSVELLGDEPRGTDSAKPRREWRPVNLTAQQALRDPRRREAWGVSFTPTRAAAVRLRFAGQAPAAVDWAEVYVGRAEGPAGGGGPDPLNGQGSPQPAR
jgi:hypothetical protein